MYIHVYVKPCRTHLGIAVSFGKLKANWWCVGFIQQALVSCGLWNAMLLHIACVIMRWVWLGGRLNVHLVCTGIFATFCDH